MFLIKLYRCLGNAETHTRFYADELGNILPNITASVIDKEFNELKKHIPTQRNIYR